LTADTIAFAYRAMPKWNPINVCSYHLQEAGATPVQELAFALATACAVLDRVKASGQVPEADFPVVVGRISFFVNAGIKFITEMCKMRAFAELWDELTATRYGVSDEKFRRFRYGVQVNSLGLTEQQPENNVYRIMIEMLSVVLSKNARARAVQLPAWNEALGLPRPWDQQWSLRLQQIVAEETDLLDHGDIFDGASEIERKVAELKVAALAELARVDAEGGAVAAVESGYLKQRLVESNTRRLGAIERGDQVVVGVNKYTDSAPSPLASGADGGFLTADPNAESAAIESLRGWRRLRDPAKVDAALAALGAAAASGANIMEPSIACAHAGVTTGEWGDALRAAFGDYRAPTGVTSAAASDGDLSVLRRRVDALSRRLGRRLTMLVGKPGLDGHSNGAEQIALRARDAGFALIYDGIRHTPKRIAQAALEADVHVVGLSILSGSHMALVGEVMDRMRQVGLADVPIVVGGIIPPADEARLRAAGVAGIYTPKHYDLTRIVEEIVELVEKQDRQAA
jgi:(2R)-ethylmalonyl-CoA mutase